MNYKKSLGRSGEQAVAAYLTKEGFLISAFNYTCRSGEIDLIAEKKGLRLFVEVKTRVNPKFDTSEVITPLKQKRIIATAYWYNAHYKDNQEMVYRFDVAILKPEGDRWLIRYIPNAFSPDGECF